MSRMHECNTLETACSTVVESLKWVSGFSRVMVYKFMGDGSGKIIAEAKDPDLEPFLNLHYPVCIASFVCAPMILERCILRGLQCSFFLLHFSAFLVAKRGQPNIIVCPFACHRTWNSVKTASAS